MTEPGGTRYDEGMTGLLEEALRRVESLSPKEQDIIASQIIETLDGEEAWNRRFTENRSALRSLAREALGEHHRGETRPLDEYNIANPSYRNWCKRVGVYPGREGSKTQ